MSEPLTIETECGSPVWRGFFTEADECGEVVTIDLEPWDEAMEAYDFKSLDEPERRPERDELFTICFGIQCPKCTCTLEWPQAWSVADAPAPASQTTEGEVTS